jgi:hypothetical protein
MFTPGCRYVYLNHFSVAGKQQFFALPFYISSAVSISAVSMPIRALQITTTMSMSSSFSHASL